MKNEQLTMNNEKRAAVKGRGAYCFAFFFLIFSFLIFSGCNNSFITGNNEALPKGKGTFSLTLSGADRAILPPPDALDSIDFAVYTLIFTPVNGGTAESVDRTKENLSEPIPLDVGTYNLVVNAYKDSGKLQLMARGTENNIAITNGNKTSRVVTLQALILGGEGTFRWNITFGQGISADMKITPASAGGTEEETITQIAANGSRPLNSGRYNVTFTLYKDGETQVKWHELLFVYQNLESVFTHTFSAGYFVNTPYTVTFHYAGVSPQSVLHGGKVTEPTSSPTRNGYIFQGWYTDEDTLNKKYNFDAPVIGSIALYAKWEPIVLDHITAVFNNDYPVYISTPLDHLKNGLTVWAHYSDTITIKELDADDYTLTGDISAQGEKTIQVSYTDGNTKTTTFPVTVKPKPAYGISLSAVTFPAAKVGYGAQNAQTVTVENVGGNPTGALTIALSGTNASNYFTLTQSGISDIAVDGTGTFTITPKSGLSAGTYDATVTVSGGNGISMEINIRFIVYILTGITLDTYSVKTEYARNEGLDLDNLVVTAHYSNGYTEAVTGYTSTPAVNGRFDGDISATESAIVTRTVTISYTESYTDGDITREASFPVNVDPNRFTVPDIVEYNAALTVIRSGGADRNYNITIAGDIAGITPLTGTSATTGFGTATGITVTLTGSGTLDTADSNGSMFYLRSGQTLVIDGAGLTLRGRKSGENGHTGDNNNAIINVQGGATLELKNGKISGNTTTSSGGGVYVYGSNATFIMYGGEILGNTSTGGGGVYIDANGTFRIVGGTVYGINESESLRNNTTTNGAVLNRGGVYSTAQRGTFVNGGWESKGDLNSIINATLRVEDGEHVVPSSFTVLNLAGYNAALATIRDGGNGRSYTININGDISGITPLTGTSATTGFGTATGITVTLKGTGTLDTADAQGSMFRMAGNQTLIIDGAGLTLRGRKSGENGHTGDNNTAIIYVQTNVTVELKNGKISGNTNTSGGGGVYIYGSNATFNMYGGEISGNTSSTDGGGVYIDSNGTFRIVGGTIYGINESNESLRNIATRGAALYIGGSYTTVQRGTFSGENGAWVGTALTSPFNATLEVENGELVVPSSFTVSNLAGYNAALATIRDGGIGRSYTINITANIAGITPLTNNPSVTTGFGTATGITVTLTGSGTLDTSDAQGSMFRLGSQQTLVIDGAGLNLRGNDNNNTAIIYVGGALELRNGRISGNTSSANGGGVIVSGTFKMSGGEISGNISSTNGGGVYVNGTNAIFTMYGGEISGNAAYNGGGVYTENSSTFRIVNGTIYGINESNENLRNTATNGAALVRGSGTVQRGKVNANGEWITASAVALNSTINATLRVEDGEHVVPGSFTVSNLAQYNAALATIRDGGNGRSYTINITGNISGITPVSNSTITTGFGTVTGITVTLTGSGTLALDTSTNGSMFRLASQQTLVIDGAGLTLRGSNNNNTAIIYVAGALELKNGKISGNTSSANGGGVYVTGTNSIFTMYGGEISGNAAGNGGGVYTENSSTFRIVNGTIYGINESDESLRNTATNGAVLYRSSGTAQRGTFTGENGAWVGTNLTSPFNDTLEVADGEFVP